VSGRCNFDAECSERVSSSLFAISNWRKKQNKYPAFVVCRTIVGSYASLSKHKTETKSLTFEFDIQRIVHRDTFL